MNRDRNVLKGPGKKALHKVPKESANEAMGKREKFALRHKRPTHRRKPSKSEVKRERRFREYPLGTGGVAAVGAGLSLVFASYTVLLTGLSEPMAN
ncbi:hypothetical protein BSKO_08047 [Bryopsis sp. KO-2023]|nr:hypothetical protein BSKO_08047 [Bryopsis sp. KO-2023]